MKEFYSKLLSAPSSVTTEILYSILSVDFVSVPTPPLGPGAEGMNKTLHFFGEVIPNLSWVPQEILKHDDRFTVRSRATGTAIGPFLPVATAANKSFDMMTIDILTVKHGRIVFSYHVEDWLTTITQLNA